MTLTLDVTDAAARFASLAGLGDNGVRYSPGRNQPGKCTRWTWLALSHDGQGFANSSPLPHAVAAWDNAPAAHRHPLTEKPFAGAVLALGATDGPRWRGDENWMYGDVVVLDGSGVTSSDWRDWGTVGTDARGVGVIGSVTAGYRHIQTGYRPVLGWQSSYGGAVLTRPGSSTPLTPLPEELAAPSTETDDTMRITWDAEGKQPTLWNSLGLSWPMTNVRAAGKLFQLPTVLTLVRRFIRADQDKAYPEKFNPLEAAILRIVFSNLK